MGRPISAVSVTTTMQPFRPHIRTPMLPFMLTFFFASPLLASDWLDSFYPYRVPITINVPTPGRYQIELTPESVTEWINEQADLKFNPRFFAFDNVKLVEVDAKGAVINAKVEAGYRMLVGKELVINGDFEQQESGKPVGWSVQHEAFKLERSSHDGSWCMTTTGADRFGCVQDVPTNPHTWYRFSCWAKGADAVTPQITRKGQGQWWQPIEHTWCDPYLPLQGWFQREYYFNTGDKSNWASEQLQVRFERYTGAVDDVSVRECQVASVLKADKPGAKRYWLYYSPLEGVTPQVPSQVVALLPEKRLTTRRAGRVERLEEGVVYSLTSSALADVWYAATTRKVLEETPPPTLRRSRIEVS
ncbi:MAG: hypothetical protein HY318_11070, partial [Armatimonadetes bacterium]|nr:hypothetical protein [Armatimonadota bacterium]